MRVVALISGGKDSTYNMMQCVAAGHQIVALANLRPADKEGVSDELDSYMYQTVGHQAIDLYAEAMGLPLYRRTIEGSSVDTGRFYTKCDGDEVEDLYQLLKHVQDAEGVEGLSVGAILSDYQRVRVENVCQRLNLQPLAFLWRRHQEDLLDEIIAAGVEAMIIKVAAFGLQPDKHLGRSLAEVRPQLVELSQKYGVHVCGEGGEFETFTLNCPLFRRRIVVDSSETVMHSADAFAPVAYLRFLQLHLEDKEAVGSTDALLSGRCPCQPVSEGEDVSCLFKDDHGERPLDSNCEFLQSETLLFDGSLECSARSMHGYRWITGITGSLDPHGIAIVEAASKQAFDSLQAMLISKGLQLKEIVLVHLYVKKMTDFAAINGVYGTLFHACPPARVCVEAPLPNGVLLWMDCLIHEETLLKIGEPHLPRQVMHVQSISHWAPANIGPYSQAIQVGETIFCAGQIALVPCTMQLACGGIRTEAVMSLGHVKKVLEAMSHGAGLHHVISATCYVTRKSYISVARAAWLKEQKKIEEEEFLSQEQVIENVTTLAVVVVPQLPRGACIEWHVIASIDEPQQRRHFAQSKEFGDWEITCEAALSSSGSCMSVSLMLGRQPSTTLTSFSYNTMSPESVDLFREVPTLFKQALEKLSEACRPLPLCFRVFYRKSCINGGTLKTELHTSLEEIFGDRAPAVVLVPVLDLPGQLVLHAICWLST